MSNKKKLGFATRQIHEGSLHIPGIAPLATPIFQTSTFVFDNTAQGAKRFAGEEEGYIYTRLGNPNAAQVAKKVASLENGEAGLVAASGIGAITTAIWTLVKSGDHILADDTLYGCTFAFLKHGISRFGVDVTFVDFSNPDAMKKALQKNTKIVYFETPCNPSLKLIDIEKISKQAHEYNKDITVMVDNTFCTPYLQRPLDLGADVVVHSATKYLNGHGDVIAGVIVGSKEYITECNLFGMKDMTGAVIGPFESFLISRGLKTLDIRMKRHCENAMIVAKYLEAHPLVETVYYPGLESHPQYDVAKKQMSGFGGMIAVILKASREKSEEMLNAFELCSLAVSLGDAETLVAHPASKTHRSYTEKELLACGLNPAMIRFSIGLEEPEDIIQDIENAFKKVFG